MWALIKGKGCEFLRLWMSYLSSPVSGCISKAVTQKQDLSRIEVWLKCRQSQTQIYTHRWQRGRLSHPSWPPIVTNRYDMTNNGEDTNSKYKIKNITVNINLIHSLVTSLRVRVALVGCH